MNVVWTLFYERHCGMQGMIRAVWLSWKNSPEPSKGSDGSLMVFLILYLVLPSSVKSHQRHLWLLTCPSLFLQCSEERNVLRIDALCYIAEVNFKIIAAETAFNQLTSSLKEINEGRILGRTKSFLTTKLSCFYPNLPLKKWHPSNT